MKTSVVYIFLTLSTLLFASGCTSNLRARVVPPNGLIFTQYKAPLTLNFRGNKVGKKKANGTTRYILEPFLNTSWGFGSAGVGEAAKEYNMKNVDYIDYEYFNVLGIYEEFKIVPQGRESK